MAIYSCTLFLNEFHLLDVKIAEELDFVDKFFVIESNQTFQANKKPLLLMGNKKYEHPKIELRFLKGKMRAKKKKGGHTPKHANQTIQRNSIADFVPFTDDDVLIVTDLDEINRAEDLPIIVDAAKKHGCVRIGQRSFYYKINLARSNNEIGWVGPFAVTGRFLRENKLKLQQIRGNRQRIGNVCPTKGKHFSFLTNAKGVAYKIRNFSHNEFAKGRFLDIEKIQERIDAGIDPFDRKNKNGGVQRLVKIEIDDTYPKTILNNLDAWKDYIA